MVLNGALLGSSRRLGFWHGTSTDKLLGLLRYSDEVDSILLGWVSLVSLMSLPGEIKHEGDVMGGGLPLEEGLLELGVLGTQVHHPPVVPSVLDSPLNICNGVPHVVSSILQCV